MSTSVQHVSTGRDIMANRSTGNLIGSATAVLAGSVLAVAIAGVGIAHADGLVASPGSVDTDGTQGSWVQPVTGSQRQPVGIQYDSHTFENGGCEIGLGNQVCQTSGLWTKASDDGDSALDADGMQSEAVRGPEMIAAPGSKASPPRGY